MITTKENDRTITLSQVRSPAPTRLRYASLSAKFIRSSFYCLVRLHPFILCYLPVQEEYFSPEIANHLLVVGGKEKGRLQLFIQLHHGLQYMVRVGCIEVGGRLIGKHQ